MGGLQREIVLTQTVGHKYVLLITASLRKKISSELSEKSEGVFKPLPILLILKTFVAFQRIHK